MNNKHQTRLFALVDGAVNPGAIRPLLESAGVGYTNIYEGLPEEDLGVASLFLAPVDDPDAAWVTQLDQIDLQSPCLSLVLSRVAADQLAPHLRAFLFASIGDGMTAMVRFFDPRNTEAVFEVWGNHILDLFMSPIDRWMYRGRHQQWQRVENDTLSGARLCTSIMIELEQKDLDLLTAHTEPDELLATLIEAGRADGNRPYLDSFTDFLPRYERAIHWGLGEPTDRLSFCEQTYLRGIDFDRHPSVAQALETRRRSGGSLSAVIESVPPYVWDEIARRRSPQP